MLLAAAVLFLPVFFSSARASAPYELPKSFKAGAVDRADIVVKSVRLTDNGDNDGFADPNETVSLYVTLRNSSGADRDGIVHHRPGGGLRLPARGQERESTVAVVFRVADVSRADPFASLSATFDIQIAGNDFGGTVRPQQLTLDLDLNVSGGLLPTSYTEGFEGGGFGTFTTQSLDAGRESLVASDSHRCQYNDPDFVNSNSYGNTRCFLGVVALSFSPCQALPADGAAAAKGPPCGDVPASLVVYSGPPRRSPCGFARPPRR